MSQRLIQDLNAEKNRILEARNKLTEEAAAIEMVLGRLRGIYGSPITGEALVDHIKESKANGGHKTPAKHTKPAYRRPQEFWRHWFENASKRFGPAATKKQLYEYALETVTPEPTLSAFKGGYERYRKQK